MPAIQILMIIRNGTEKHVGIRVNVFPTTGDHLLLSGGETLKKKKNHEETRQNGWHDFLFIVFFFQSGDFSNAISIWLAKKSVRLAEEKYLF